eukprot:4952518-Pyramimonas_sp.AAC.1
MRGGKTGGNWPWHKPPRDQLAPSSTRGGAWGSRSGVRAAPFGADPASCAASRSAETALRRPKIARASGLELFAICNLTCPSVFFEPGLPR